MEFTDIAVELINYSGNDLMIVNAARVSFAKHKTKLDENDRRLISYLARNGHWTPFAHCFATFRIKAPIFVARQLVKHQVGLVWNEMSRRYVDSPPEFYMPAQWRSRPPKSIKQGSGGPVSRFAYFVATRLIHFISSCSNLAYRFLLYLGVAPEQARIVLPQNMMTEWYWSGSLAAFARVCKLRMDAHAQRETSEVAWQIALLLEKQFPVAWKALMEG